MGDLLDGAPEAKRLPLELVARIVVGVGDIDLALGPCFGSFESGVERAKIVFIAEDNLLICRLLFGVGFAVIAQRHQIERDLITGGRGPVYPLVQRAAGAQMLHDRVDFFVRDASLPLTSGQSTTV